MTNRHSFWLAGFLALMWSAAAFGADARVVVQRGVPTLFIDGKPSSAVMVHHWDAWSDAARAFAKRGIRIWSIGIQTSIWPDAMQLWEQEVERELKALTNAAPDALVILRLGLSWYPYEEEFFPEIAAAGDGRKWARMHGRSKWLQVGAVTERDAPPRKWTRVVFDISKVDRRGVVRLIDLNISKDDPRIPRGTKLRFYIDHVEYFSSNDPGAREVVAEMETSNGWLDEGRYPRPALIVAERAKFGKRALLWEHTHDGERGALVAKGVKWAGAARDMSKYDRLAFWIYPDTDAPFSILVRVVSGYRRVGRASFASDRWADDYKEMLRRLIVRLERSPLGKHVIGICLSAGLTAEWCWPGHGQVDGVDFCPAAVTKWRQWLRQRYGTVQALRTAWGDDAKNIATFDDVQPPAKDARLRPADLGDFRCPKRSRMLMFLLDLPMRTLATREMQRYQRDGDVERVFYDDDTFVEVDWVRKSYRIVFDGRPIAHDWTTMVQTKPNGMLIYSRDGGRIECPLPAGMPRDATKLTVCSLTAAERIAWAVPL